VFPAGNPGYAPTVTILSFPKTIVLSALCLALNLAACNKEKKKAPPAEPAPPETPLVTGDTPELPIKPATPVAVPATEEERALAKTFIVRFADAIEAEKSDNWAALHTKERRADLLEKNAVEESYKAWRLGTATVVHLIRTAEFKLEKTSSTMKLVFESIMVPNDPETVYSMRVAIEDGQMYLAEK
jgi:hypothetical protein